EALEEVEADAAHAAVMKVLQLALGDRWIDHGDTASLAPASGDGVQRSAIVRAVAARLDDHVLRKAQVVAQREQHFGAGILGQVLGLGAERKVGHRPKHVAMRIHRASRRDIARLRGIRVPADDTITHAKTTPSIRLRAVRSRAALTTSPPSSTSRTQVISPVGCSTDKVLRLPSGIAATSAAGDPSSRHAVATLTAPSTPIVAWARCGMKLRTVTAPPCCGGATSIILGTLFSVTSPRFMRGPAARRIASIFARMSANLSDSSSSRVS